MSQVPPVEPNCPTDCLSELPAVDFSKCNPVTHGAQIQRIFLTNVGNSFSDWTDAAEWISRLNNSGSGASDVRTLHVVGSKPAPDSQKITISLGRIITGKKKHKLPIKIDETNDTNYAFLRQNECGGQYLMWYETAGRMLYGGNSGIPCSLTLDDVIVEDSGQLETFDGEFTWESQFTPERIASPIAA